MKKNNFKKLLSGVVSASMLLSALPVVMAAEATPTGDFKVIYEDDFQSSDLKVWYRDTSTKAELKQDPTDENNQAVFISTTGTTDDCGYKLNTNLRKADGWDIWSASDTWKTFKDFGVIDGRAIVYSADVYIPADFASQLTVVDNYWSTLRMGPQLGGAFGRVGMPISFGFSGSGSNVVKNKPWVGEQNWDDASKEMTVDAWHNLKWIVEGSGDNTVVTVYLDEQKVYDKKAKTATGYNADNVFGSLEFYIPGKVELTAGSGFYTDNLKIYQAKADLTAEFNYDGEAKKATLTFNNPVNADMASKIKVTDTAGNSITAPVTIANKVATIDFTNSSLKTNTTYKVTTTGLTDEAYQSLATNEFSFTTEPEAVTYFYKNDFSGETTKVVEFETGITSLAQDPVTANSENQVLKMTASNAATIDERTFNVALTDTTGKSYTQKGYISGRPIVYEMKLYIPNDFIQGENAWGYNGFKIGPTYSDSNNTWPQQGRKAYKIGINQQHGDTKAESGYAYISEDVWGSSNRKITTNAWHDYKWEITGTGADTKVSMWIDGTILFKDMTAETKFEPSLMMEGIRLAQSGATKIVAGTSLYVDDVKVYQISKAFEGTFAFDQLTEKGTLNFSQKITESDLANIVVKDAKGNAVTAKKELSAKGKTVTISFNEQLESSATYTVDLSALKDAYGQSLATDTFTFVTAKNPIKTIYSANYDGDFKVLKTYSGVTSSKEATIADKAGNADNKALSLWSSGTINEANKHYLNAYLTNETDVWGGAKTYSQYSSFVSGKPIVYEADVYVTSGFTSALAGHWGNEAPLSPVFSTGNGTYGEGSPKTYFAKEGNGAALKYGTGEGKRKVFTENTWHSLKWVLEPTENSTAATLTSYLDGVKIATSDVTFDPANVKMYGINVGKSHEGSAIPEDSLFIDNVRIWQSEATFGMNGAIYDASEGAILLSTGTRPTQETINAITLKLGDTDVTNLITRRVWDDENSKLKLFVPFESLRVSAQYTLTMPQNSEDAFGQMITAEQTATFTTPKSKSIAIKEREVTAPSASGASVSVTMQNGGGNTGDAWVVMAVYGDYNELLGVDQATVTLGGGAEKTETLETSVDCSKAKEIKIYVWDSAESMIPLQECESVWTAQAE